MNISHLLARTTVFCCIPLALAAPGSSNPTPITINDNANASLYPSVINVPDSGPIGNVAVQLNGLTHGRLSDLTILLVSPSGKKVQLIAGATGSADATDLGLSEEGLSLATNEPVNSENRYRITVNPTPVLMPAPAPGLPYLTSLSSLIGENAQGNWSLYIRDNVTGVAGTVAGGWSLALSGGGGTFLIPDFDYQGVLRDSAGPLNGLFDIRMRFFSSPIAAGPDEGEATALGVPVENGVFTARFTPSSSLFTEGFQRWAEISVKGTNDAGFVTVGPRQLVASSPYANFAAKARSAVFADVADAVNVVKWSSIIEVPLNVLNAFSPWQPQGGGAISYNSGKVLVGTTTGNSLLTVNGVIESISGGVKFPDGSLQTSAVAPSIVASGTATVDFSSIAAGGESAAGVGVSGSLLTTDVVVVSPQTDLPSDLGIEFARVVSSSQIRFRIRNHGTVAADPPAIIFNYKVIR